MQVYGLTALAAFVALVLAGLYLSRRARKTRQKEEEKMSEKLFARLAELKSQVGDNPRRGVQPLLSLAEYFLKMWQVARECHAPHRASVHLKLVGPILNLVAAIVEARMVAYSSVDRLLVALHLLKQMKLPVALQELEVVWKEPSLPIEVRCLTLASVIWATRTQGNHGLAEQYEMELSTMPELLAECEKRGLNVSFVIN